MDYSAALTKATKFLEVIINGILIEFDMIRPFLVCSVHLQARFFDKIWTPRGR